jgi:hypothetical protein
MSDAAIRKACMSSDKSKYGRFIMIGGHHSTRALKMWCQEKEEEVRKSGVPVEGSKFLKDRVVTEDGKLAVKPFRDCYIYRFSQIPVNPPGVDPMEMESLSDNGKKRTVVRMMGKIDNTSSKSVSQYSAVSPYL